MTVHDLPPPTNDNNASRSAIAIDVDDRPIPVQIGRNVFEFVGVLGSRRMAQTLGPVQDMASQMRGSNDTEELVAFTDRIMVALADLLDDQSDRERWLAQELPINALVAIDRPSVLSALMAEWTGRPLDNA